MRISLLIKLAIFTFVFFLATIVSAQSEDHGHHDDEHEIEEIVVQATRSRRRLQDEPTRVEVLNQEEIEEKILMRPGNISMLLAETGGLRVQVTSPALGSANIRVQGLRGRYTQLLADGLPLFGGQAASLGLLQTPPSDLGQVEVIKGAASALYGGQALGGVINLVSKRPQAEPGGELILNATTRDAQDVSAYASSPLAGGWRGTLLSTYNRQSNQDLDDDGWIDMPGYQRMSLRPRLFWDGDDGASLFLTLGAMTEERRGGTTNGRLLPDGLPFAQNQDTDRLDAGVIYERPIGDRSQLQLRAAGVQQSHDHLFGSLLEEDQHRTLLAEASLFTELLNTSWVTGVAWQTDKYQSDTFPGFDYTYKSPALFAQVDKDLSADVAFAGSVRWDNHSEYGDQVSPRLSLLYRPGSWTIRGSWGGGFYAPTPFVEETEAAGLARLAPLSGLDRESVTTAALDFGYAAGGFETGLTLFQSEIDDAIRLQTLAVDRVQLINVEGSTRTRGAEVLLRWRQGPYVLTGSYLFVDAREAGDANMGRRDVPLTPKHSAGLVAMWEDHDRGRIGLEVYYTGTQPLEDNVYRARGEAYFQMGLLGEIVLGRYRVFLNLENLLNVRQTRKDPLVRLDRAPDGRWTVDAWAPVDGFVANAGVRVRF